MANHAKTKRNQAIYAQYKKGISPYQIAVVYKITAPRVYVIIRQEKKKERK